MGFIRFLLVLFTALQGLYAYDTADVRFEVETLGSKRLVIKAFEGSKTLFSQMVDSHFKATLMFSNTVLSRHESGYRILYKGQDKTSLGLDVDEDGNISLENSSKQTGFSARKAWGFKTPGIIHHSGHSLFYKLLTQAQAFHNHGLLKAYTGDFKQNYLFNGGILHFGDETPYVDLVAYQDYLPFLNPNAQPVFQQGIIDDQGVLIAEKGLRVRNLTYRAQGLTDIGGAGLVLENASLDNLKTMMVEGPVQGYIPTFTNQGLFYADSMDPSRLSLHTWHNHNQVYLGQESTVLAQELWNNEGNLFVRGNATVGSRKKAKALGAVIADGVIKNLIEEALDEATSKALFAKASFFSGKRKVILTRLQHTDHYLNTITHHYTVDHLGRQTFTHTTETGYIFQHRTTEKLPQEVEVEGSETPQEVHQYKNDLQGRKEFLKALKQGLKERLKKLGTLQANHNSILAALMKGLSEAGLSSEDIQDILGGQEVINNLLDLTAAYEQLDDRGRQKLNTDLPEVGSFLNHVASSAHRLGLPVWQWVQHHGAEFVDGFCNMALLAARYTKHPYVVGPAGVCALGQLGPKAAKNLQQAQLFFNKKYEGSGKNHGGGQAPQRIANPPKAESPVWRDLKPYKGQTRTDGEKFYQWDYTHNDIEVFSTKGSRPHLGSMDPVTGKIYKPALKERYLNDF